MMRTCPNLADDPPSRLASRHCSDAMSLAGIQVRDEISRALSLHKGQPLVNAARGNLDNVDADDALGDERIILH